MISELNELKKFWKGKKVFITGHTGFKGTWLSVFLNLLGARLYGYSLKPEKNSLFKKILCKKLYRQETYADIGNFNLLKKKILQSKAEIIFHLAAQPLVIESYKNPTTTFKTNIYGTINLLEVLRSSINIKSVIIVTTDKVYKTNKNNLSLNEDNELGGGDPYSASKVCKEIIVESYNESFFKNKNKINISTVRSGNVLGGGDYSKNRIIPDIIEAIKNKKKLIIRNPKYIRPWQHVIEPLTGYVILAQKQYNNKLKKIDNKWNFGPQKKNFITVEDIVKKINKLQKIKKIEYRKSKYIETREIILDSKKAKKKLNWRSRLKIDDIIKNIIEIEFSNNNNFKNIMEKQIVKYFY